MGWSKNCRHDETQFAAEESASKFLSISTDISIGIQNLRIFLQSQSIVNKNQSAVTLPLYIVC